MTRNRILGLFLPVTIALLVSSCGNKTKQQTTSSAGTKPVEVKVMQYEALQAAYTKHDNVLYVVNFWATWCTPCVKELPAFMAVNETFKDKSRYKMILVSLDDAGDLETRVKPMIADLNLTVEQYLLDDVTRMNTWIPAINPDWQGTIPATLFIRNGQTLYFESASLDKATLESLIKQYL